MKEKMIPYVDVHTHLDHCATKGLDVDTLVREAKEAGVKKIITNGTTPQKNRECLAFAKKYEIVSAALGLYPNDGITMSGDEVDDELRWISKQKPIAIGEVGIDMHWDKDHYTKQEENFLKVISLSEKIKKPLIVHSRGAEQEVVDLLISSTVKNVNMHCFAGGKKLVKKVEDQGWYLSIPPNIAFSSHFQMIASTVNVGSLLTETDAPYLGPIKGVWNEPKNVIISVLEISRIKKMTVEETANNIYLNATRLFKFN